MVVEKRPVANTQPIKPSSPAARIAPYGWQPGQSGNPSGRPKLALEFRERAKVWANSDGWKLLLEIAETARQPADRMRAIELILAYGLGKPTAHVKAEVDVRGVHIVLPTREAIDTVLGAAVAEHLVDGAEFPALPEPEPES